MTANGSTPLLLWDVDTQVDFMMPDGKLYVAGAEDRLENLRRLTEAARDHSIPVVASADDHLESDAEISDEPDWSATFPPHCMRGTPGAERVAATQLDPTAEFGLEAVEGSEIERLLAGDATPVVLLKKNQLDVFTNPNTEAVLETLAPERIVLYGVATDFCNRAAIEGLLSRGYGGRLAMVEDAVQAINADALPELIANWKESGLELITTEQAVALTEQAGSKSD